MTAANIMAVADVLDDYVDTDFDERDYVEVTVEDSRIMVVDDDAGVATLMCRLLERDGFRHVVTVGDGHRALEIVLEHAPDIVVLDVHLPRLDGFEVLHEILRHDVETGRVTGVLAVSGDAAPKTCQTMLWAGADDFIARPFASADFALRVRRIAQRTRTLRQAMGHTRLLEARVRGPHESAPSEA